MVEEAISPHTKALLAGRADKPWVGLECRVHRLSAYDTLLCQSLGFAAKLISGQGTMGPTRIISSLLKLWKWPVLLL